MEKEDKVLSRTAKTAKTVMKATPLKPNPPFPSSWLKGRVVDSDEQTELEGRATSPSSLLAKSLVANLVQYQWVYEGA